ncbi:MAG: hypothetical protein EBU90_30305 [Proteobacteria bacterium]|nr:hypothetical protein [Pseudomonadota bacterium]
MPEGPKQIVAILQSSLALHWAAIEAYTLQSRHYAAYGYPKLAEKYAGDAEEERGHAHKLIDRLEFYNVTPEAQQKPTTSWSRRRQASSGAASRWRSSLATLWRQTCSRNCLPTARRRSSRSRPFG